MDYLNRLERMEYMILLIEKESTGPPNDFAAALDISRSELYYLLNKLKEFEVEVAYSRKRRTFYFNGSLTLEILNPFRVKNRNK